MKDETSEKKTAKLPEIDPEALAQIEREAAEVAKDFCKLTAQLKLSLNHISAASVCCLQTYRDSIDKHCDSIEECVKEEEALLNKAKDLSKTMEPIYKLQQKISQIKTVVTTLENHI